MQSKWRWGKLTSARRAQNCCKPAIKHAIPAFFLIVQALVPSLVPSLLYRTCSCLLLHAGTSEILDSNVQVGVFPRKACQDGVARVHTGRFLVHNGHWHQRTDRRTAIHLGRRSHSFCTRELAHPLALNNKAPHGGNVSQP